mmetsp:Transcript_21372/g.38088  ORF Transcript_21372/g.38088 Transcript_21372/m.38088 type:complete len:177 (-) Transcript_21372:56-586(-)
MATARTGKWTRRCSEVFSGFALAEIQLVRQELHHPVLSTEDERRRLRDPRGYAGPIATSAASAVGVSYLARCIGIARFGHTAHSFRNRAVGLATALPYFVILAGLSAWSTYAEVIDEILCPAEDTALAVWMRHRGAYRAPSQTRSFLQECEKSRCRRLSSLSTSTPESSQEGVWQL